METELIHDLAQIRRGNPSVTYVNPGEEVTEIKSELSFDGLIYLMQMLYTGFNFNDKTTLNLLIAVLS